jgi:hypothetical protein
MQLDSRVELLQPGKKEQEQQGIHLTCKQLGMQQHADSWTSQPLQSMCWSATPSFSPLSMRW